METFGRGSLVGVKTFLCLAKTFMGIFQGLETSSRLEKSVRTFRIMFKGCKRLSCVVEESEDFFVLFREDL